MKLEEKFLNQIRNYITTPNAEKEHRDNELHQYCRLVDLYVHKGFSIKDSRGMAKSVISNQVINKK